MKFMEDEIAHAKKNYTPQKGPELAKNLIEDEEFDVNTYNFFLDYIEKFKEHPLASKIKLVLSYITEINPHTNRPIYTNKDKNMLLHFWKSEYDNAFQLYSEKIKNDLEKKKKEKKSKTRIFGARESMNPSINFNFINKKKSNVKYSFIGEQNNNLNNEIKLTGNNFDNSNQKISTSKDIKK